MYDIQNSDLLFWEIIGIKIIQSNFASFDLLTLLWTRGLKCFISRGSMSLKNFIQGDIKAPQNTYTWKLPMTIDCSYNQLKEKVLPFCQSPFSVSFQKNRIRHSYPPSVSRVLALLQESRYLFQFFNCKSFLKLFEGQY